VKFYTSSLVGINTLPNLNYKLDVNGIVNATEFRLNGINMYTGWSNTFNNSVYTNSNVIVNSSLSTSGIISAAGNITSAGSISAAGNITTNGMIYIGAQSLDDIFTANKHTHVIADIVNISNIFNNNGQTSNAYSTFDSIPNYGFWQVTGITAGSSRPLADVASYYNITQGVGSDYNDWKKRGVQYALPAYNDTSNYYFMVRHWDNNAAKTWNKIWAGKADIADKLSKSIKINGADFDGTQDINIVGSKWSNLGSDISYSLGNVILGASNIPKQLLHLQKTGLDNYIKVDAGDTVKNAGIMLCKHNSNYGMAMRFDGSANALKFSLTSNDPIQFADLMTLTSNGNLGIGRYPGYKLDVTGDINATELRIAGSTLDSKYAKSTHSHTINDVANISKLFNNSNLDYSTFNTFDSIPDGGFWYVHGVGTNQPIQGISQYYNFTQTIGKDNAWTADGVQYALPRDANNNYLLTRQIVNNSKKPWSKIWAGKADMLSSNVTINGIAFDGTKSITISAQWTNIGNNITYNLGNVGIAKVPDANYKLDVGGNTYVDGTLRATGDVISAFSDMRLKDIVGKIDNPIDKIMQISTFKYKPNDTAVSLNLANTYEKNKVNIGLSAQDVQEVLPELVTLAPFDVDDNERGLISKSGSNYLTVSYERMVPLLIECIKDLKKEIELLKMR
jgi:hypothetical protein